jgi:hypothetical protein
MKSQTVVSMVTNEEVKQWYQWLLMYSWILLSKVANVQSNTMTWLTVTKYLCLKWPRICSVCHNHHLVLSWLITWFVTRVTQWVPHVEQELLTLPEYLSSTPLFSGVCIAWYLVFCVMFCKSLFVLLTILTPLSFYLQLLITPLVSSNFSYSTSFVSYNPVEGKLYVIRNERCLIYDTFF